MKRFLGIIISLLITLGINAGNEFHLGYCEHKIAEQNGQGADKAGEVSAAIFVPESNLKTLVGNDITRIDVGMISRINVRNLQVWVRHSLDGENLAEATIERGAVGWNEIALAKPYTISSEDKGLYIGFSYTNGGSSHPVSFVGTGSVGTSFFKASAEDSWRDMSSVGNLSLEAIVTGSSLPLYDATLNSVSITPNLSLGKTGYTVSGEVGNIAINDITGFQLTLSAEGMADQLVDVKTTVKSGKTARFSVDFKATTNMQGEVKATITKLNDGTDANLDNNSAFAVVSFLRNVLIEEFTTEKCPNCPAAATGLHQALESNDMYAKRVIPVCHHSGFYTDWLTRDCDKDLLCLYNDGGQTYAPAFMFDRQPVFDSAMKSGQKDNVVGIRLKEDFVECIGNAMTIPTHALVGINVVDVKDHDVTFEVSVVSDGAFAAKNPVLTVYLTEDDITARSQEGASGTYLHQHVIRWDNGTWGDAVSMKDNLFSKTYTVTISEDWETAKMHIVAFVANHDADNILNNQVENAASIQCPIIKNGPSDTPITTQPAGTMMEDVQWSSNACRPDGKGSIEWVSVGGFVPSVVINGKKMYIKSPITQLAELAQAWIEGTISDDGSTVTFHTPQPYMINNGTQVLYASRLNEQGKLDAANLDLVFSFDGNNLTQTDGGTLAITDLNGNFYGYGDRDIRITKLDEQVVVLPEGAELQSYVMECGSGKSKTKQTAKIAFCGNDVYFSDPVGVENSWFKGTLNGNTISVPTKQYMGAKSGYPLYLNSGEAYSYTQTDAMGQPQLVTSYRILKDEAIIFTYDEKTGVLATNQTLLFNAGRDELGVAYVGYAKPVYTPWTPVPARPANPSIEQFIDLDPYASYGMKGGLIGFTVPSSADNGDFIAQENLYYQICFDGKAVELYGTTYIPYYGQVEDAAAGLFLSCNGDIHQLQLAYKPKSRLSIQSFYVVGDNYYTSDIIGYSLVNGELVADGIDEVSSDATVVDHVNFYDITGKRVDMNSARGILIRETVYKNGSRQSNKLILK